MHRCYSNLISRSEKKQKLKTGINILTFVIIYLVTFAGLIKFYELKQQAEKSKIEAKTSEINNIINASVVFYKSGNTLQALVESIRAADKLKKWKDAPEDIKAPLQKIVKEQLEKMLTKAYQSGEYNRLLVHKGAVRSVRFSQDGKLLASGGEDGKVVVWNFETIKGKFQQENQLDKKRINSVAINKSLMIGQQNHVKIWKSDTDINNKPKPNLLTKGNQGQIMTVEFSLNGHLLAWGTDLGIVNISKFKNNSYTQSEFDKTLDLRKSLNKNTHYRCLSNITIEKNLRPSAKTQNNVVYGIALIDDKNLAIARGDWCVWLWNYQDNSSPYVVGQHDNKVRSLSFNQQTNLFASGGEDGVIDIYQWLDKAKDFDDITYGKHSGSVRSVSFSKDGKYLATGSEDGTIKVFKSEKFSLARGHKKGITADQIFTPNLIVYSVSYSPDGKYIASGQADGTIRIWRTNTPQPPKPGADIDSLIQQGCSWVGDYLQANYYLKKATSKDEIDLKSAENDLELCGITASNLK